jgi:DNA polymerase family A
MPLIDTSDEAALQRLSAHDLYQVYNGLDTCVTMEIYEVLSKQLSPAAADLYRFEKGMQGLALDMMLRGFFTDAYVRQQLTAHYTKVKDRVESILNRFARAIWQRDLNPRSPKQLKEFFYGALALPEQTVFDKGVRRVSTDRASLERLQAYFYTIPIINSIFEIRDATKKLSVLTTGISRNGRFHSTFSPASTETGRWSSSKDSLGEGGNAQNITSELRRMFISDPGFKLLHFDQEQAESRLTGLLLKAYCNDNRYIRACESSDLHTEVAKLVWPSIVTDRASAETPYYRHFTYRDMAKRGGHLSNYMGKPLRMSEALKLPLKTCEEFQQLYYQVFGLPKYHQWVAQQIQLYQKLITPLGMERKFFGNPYDDDVLRSAIAFIPQSTIGQLTSLIAYRCWRQIPELQPLTHDHDGFTFQFPDDPDLEKTLFQKVRTLGNIKLELNNTSITIPLDFSSGWNWQKNDKNNPDGLLKWRGSDARTRTSNIERKL